MIFIKSKSCGCGSDFQPQSQVTEVIKKVTATSAIAEVKAQLPSSGSKVRKESKVSVIVPGL